MSNEDDTDTAVEILACARYGDDEELNEILSQLNDKDNFIVNYQDESGNSALHMACANGHLECVKVLFQHGAKHNVTNKNGNLPLHWAVQNKAIDIVKFLLKSYPDIDVLAQNNFGRGCVTEAFQAEDTDIVAELLSHKSATEEKLAKGSGLSKDSIKIDDEVENEESSSTPSILQETKLTFQFHQALPKMKVRELALNWEKNAFGKTADEDITGVSIWSASLILSRWIVDLKTTLEGKSLLELGSGCGVSGIASFMYTKASSVILSDYFPQTVNNLLYNVALNIDMKEGKIKDSCSECGLSQRLTVENPEGKLMLCGRCQSVQYCSKTCQKKAWPNHKRGCAEMATSAAVAHYLGNNTMTSKECHKRSIDVISIDWEKEETWPQNQKFDVIFGSDLVYHEDIVPVLVNTIDRLLSPGGRFLHVASQQRNSIIEFKTSMESKGFSCQINLVPSKYQENPLIDCTNEFFDLHFNEMQDTYCMYEFSKTP